MMSSCDSAEVWSSVGDLSVADWGDLAISGSHEGGHHGPRYEAVGDRLVAHSPAMRCLLAAMDRYLDAPHVLLEGETGTGKDLVARVLHRRAGDGASPFQELDSPHLSPQSFQEQLEHLSPVANGGTLLVTEILDLPLENQVHLSRALEIVCTSRGAGSRARIVCVTQQDVEVEAREGRLLMALRDRLRPFRLRVPALRERREDLLELIRVFLHELAVRYGRGPRELAPEVWEALQTHPWKGNVRELRNELERLVVLAPAGHAIGWGALSPALRSRTTDRTARSARPERRKGWASRWLFPERFPKKTAATSSEEPARCLEGTRSWRGRARRRSRR
jgi:DNA-binding NtrC family response regulator